MAMLPPVPFRRYRICRRWICRGRGSTAPKRRGRLLSLHRFGGLFRCGRTIGYDGIAFADRRFFDTLSVLRLPARPTGAAAAAPAAFFAVTVFVFVVPIRALGALKRFAVFLRDLIIVGVNFAKRQETMTVAAEFHEGRLQGLLDPGDLRKIDVSL